MYIICIYLRNRTGPVLVHSINRPQIGLHIQYVHVSKLVTVTIYLLSACLYLQVTLTYSKRLARFPISL